MLDFHRRGVLERQLGAAQHIAPDIARGVNGRLM